MLLNYNIISPNSLQFKKVEQLLVDSFPVDERRDMLDFERIARENPRFSLLGALEGNNVKGFITTWDFDSFCYVEHFAVDSSVRNQGIGSRLLDHFVAQAAKPVILEVELPADLPACRRIAFYGMKGKTALGQNRYNGYHDALLKAGMQPDESLVFVCDNREDAERITPDILRREDRPDAFFCVNDDTAIGVMYTAKHNGFRVPDDVSVCGFTNGERAIACDPQLTTVEQRGTKVGEEAATILMDKVEGITPRDHIEKRVVRTRLVVRESTKS